MVHGNYMKIKFHCPKIKFYWHAAMLVFLCRNYGCFTLQWQSWDSGDRDHMVCRAENTYSPALYRRSVPTIDFINYWTKVASQVIINQCFVSCSIML